MQINIIRMTGAFDILNSLDKMGEKKFVPSIGPIKGKILLDIVKKYCPQNILEIGTLYGYSSILMATVVSDTTKITSIEINKTNADISKRNVVNAGFSEKITILNGNALQILPKLSGRFDLLFLDASKNEYLAYLHLAEYNGLIGKGSVIVADNVIVSENEMQDYLDYVRKSGVYKSQTIETTLEFSKDVKDAIELSDKIL